MFNSSQIRMVAAAIIAATLLFGCDSSVSTPPQQAVATASISTPTTASGNTTPLPTAPLATASQQTVATASVPAPTNTATDTATPYPYPTAPVATVLSQESINPDSAGTPIIWAVESKESLTIWLGYFNDQPTAQMTNAHPLLQWQGNFIVLDMKVSPSKRSVAALVSEDKPQEGLARWIALIDLNTNSVQSASDYMAPETSGAYSILGWIDETTIAFQSFNSVRFASLATRKATQCPFPVRHWGAVKSALSPDRRSILSLVIGDQEHTGYWRYNVDCSNLQKVVDSEHLVPGYNLSWSSDGKTVSFFNEVDPDATKQQVWTLDVESGKQQPLTESNAWSADPVWSPDGKRLAYLQASTPPRPNEQLDPNHPWAVDANIFVTGEGLTAARQLNTSQPRAHANLTWINSNYLVMASGTKSSRTSLVAISLTGQATNLQTAPTGAGIVWLAVVR